MSKSTKSILETQNKLSGSIWATKKLFQQPKFVYMSKETLLVSKQTPLLNEDKDVCIFDIDETLYPHDDDILKMRDKKIVDLGLSFGFTLEQFKQKSKEYVKKHRSTIRGLVNEFPVGKDLQKLLENPVGGTTLTLKPDRYLKEMLLKIKARRVCFTNASMSYSREVLERINMMDCFDTIFCCDYADKDHFSKPDTEAYQIVMRILGVRDASKLHFFDDKYINIESALGFGWNCFHITRERPLKLLLDELHTKNYSNLFLK